MKKGDIVRLTLEGWNTTWERVQKAAMRRTKVDNLPTEYHRWVDSLAKWVDHPLELLWMDNYGLEDDTCLAQAPNGRKITLYKDTLVPVESPCLDRNRRFEVWREQERARQNIPPKTPVLDQADTNRAHRQAAIAEGLSVGGYTYTEGKDVLVPNTAPIPARTDKLLVDPKDYNNPTGGGGL